MRVIICGDRNGYTPSAVRLVLEALVRDHGSDLTVIHGGARGVDSIAGGMARGLGITVEEFPADWRRHPKVAGFIRNQAMLESGAELVVAFKRGFDRTLSRGGTEHMCRIADDAGVPYIVVDEEPAGVS
jgi:hypothetical protein